MALELKDQFVWDFWFAVDGEDVHVFYLQASRALPDPELRHWNVSIGHAKSQDLRHWQVLPDALAPSPTPGWDDYTTWTGSIIQHAGLWHLFYTGTSRAEHGLVQRIGLATSPDLLTWTRHPDNPLIVADPRWYEELDLSLWHDQAWRDPWVFKDPETGLFHAYLTARVNHGRADGRGVIAHASSQDLVHWTVHPPVTDPGDFGQMEVPQLLYLDGRWVLLFCGSTKRSSATRKQRTGADQIVIGTHYLIGDGPKGPFRYETDEFLVGDTVGSLYAGKLIEWPAGRWNFLAWRRSGPDGSFIGALSDPYPVTCLDGVIHVDTTS